MRENNITLSLKNIILFLNNLTGHFTGVQKIITLSLIILMLSFVNITLCFSNNFVLSLFGLSNSSVSALSYESEVGIGFTFNPTISISLSSSDLVIPSLTPGTTSESNSINVNVATNAAYGYTLSATVDNANLTHTNETNTFDSIATNANLPNLNTDNTWGYTTSLDSGSTWSNYNGLSNSSNKKLLDLDTNTPSAIDFKIAAKASNTQASGTYTNTVNFIAIARVSLKTIADLEYLQDFADLDAENLASVKSSMSTRQTHTLKDKRDEQAYTIAKLNDGKIWMTKNLNLAGGTEITNELSDVPENYTLPTANGFQEGNKLPASSQEGFSDNTKAYVYNTDNNTDNCTSPGCYSYYSWNAATAGSGVNITTNNTDAPYSICSKGWKLPNSRDTNDPNWKNADFYQLAIAYGMNPGNISQNISTFYNNAGPNTIPNLTLAGYYNHYNSNPFSDGNIKSFYWSATASVYSGYAKNLFFNSTTINSASHYARGSGFSVRCLAQ